MGKKHPLELFRENPEGFEHASRTRRTVAGRVVGSQLRPSPPAVAAAREGKSGTKAGARKARPKARKASSGKRGPLLTLDSLRPTNKKALYGVLAIFGAFALYLWGASNTTPALKRPSEEVFSTGTAAQQPGPPPAKAAARTEGPEYAIVAATYAGTAHGQEIASLWRDVLRDDGYPRAQILGYPGKNKSGYERIELLVGRAARMSDLDRLLEQVRRYPGPKNDPAPFADAFVIEVPESAKTGS